MRLKELSKKDIKYANKIYHDKSISWDERMRILTEYFDRSERTVRKWCSEHLGFKEKIETPSEHFQMAQERVHDKTKKRFIITWAQNDTSVHKPFLKNIEAYAEFIKADIHVIAGRYKNPTAFGKAKHDSWSSDILKYLDAGRHNIHKYVSIMSDVKIQPTAVSPMSGMEGMSGINSCIFGSPKVQMTMIPVIHGQKPKMMLTTGAITKKNYIDSKAGKKGEFHHTFGFIIVEIKDDETFFVRQVTARENGSFIDLFHKVEQGNVTPVNSVAAIILGDYHVGDQDNLVIDKTLQLMKKIKPQHVVIHDLFNGHSINHHEMDNAFIQYENEMSNKNSLKKEIEDMLSELDKFKNYNITIVRSNHDDFVDRWLINTDWRKAKTPKNSLEYMIYSAAILSGDAKNGVIPWVISQRYPLIKTLSRADSFIIKHWELGQHGDMGANGSRGTLDGYRKLNTKLVIGHSHTPGRKDGVLQIGTSTKLRLSYNRGASSWLQSHVIIHEDGKAQHINFFNNEFTTFKY